MVIGPFINASAVLLGGVFGALLSQRLPERIRVSMTSIFGLASLGIGILLVVKCANLPAMVLATLLGALIGEICLLEKGVNTVVAKAHNLFHHSRKKPAHESFIQNFVAIIVLFCEACVTLALSYGQYRFELKMVRGLLSRACVLLRAMWGRWRRAFLRVFCNRRPLHTDLGQKIGISRCFLRMMGGVMG